MTDLPTIAVHCFADGDHLLRISLELANTFSFHCHNASPSLDSLLGSWTESYLTRKEVPFRTIPDGTLFQQKVWGNLVLIPFGAILSYGELAQKIGNPNAQRAVGGACHRNPYPLFIPCHRVVQANKKLGGFALDLEIKIKLLEFERGNASLEE